MLVVRASNALDTRDMAAPATGNPKEHHSPLPVSSRLKHRSRPRGSLGSAERKPGKCESKVPNAISSDATVTHSRRKLQGGKGREADVTSVPTVGREGLCSLPVSRS